MLDWESRKAVKEDFAKDLAAATAICREIRDDKAASPSDRFAAIRLLVELTKI